MSVWGKKKRTENIRKNKRTENIRKNKRKREIKAQMTKPPNLDK